MAVGRRSGWGVGALAGGRRVDGGAGTDRRRQGVDRPAAARASHAADAGHRDFAGLVEIDGGRRLYLECRGQGTPTVVLESGGGDAADIWDFRPPGFHGTPALPAAARYTRVCAYDRPGTVSRRACPAAATLCRCRALPPSSSAISMPCWVLRASRSPMSWSATRWAVC